jgi:2-phosphoglycerate kinase
MEMEVVLEMGKHPLTATKEGARTCWEVVLQQDQFLDIVRYFLQQFKYRSRSLMDDFKVSCDMRKRFRPIMIFLGGTSGCGKSTLGSLLASRMGISTVFSTDTIRNILRTTISKEEDPLLWASTYHCGDVLESMEPDMDPSERVLEGYRRQCKTVFTRLRLLVKRMAEHRRPLIVEGVHLLPELVLDLMKEFPYIIPFAIYISNENKHRERFATRSRYMTLEPRYNRYVKYFRNIRMIQGYICSSADKVRIPHIDNTNVDRTIAFVHSTTFSFLKHSSKGQPLLDTEKRVLQVPTFRLPTSIPWSGKRMLKRIQKKVRKRELTSERHVTFDEPHYPSEKPGRDILSFVEMTSDPVSMGGPDASGGAPPVHVSRATIVSLEIKNLKDFDPMSTSEDESDKEYQKKSLKTLDERGVLFPSNGSLRRDSEADSLESSSYDGERFSFFGEKGEAKAEDHSVVEEHGKGDGYADGGEGKDESGEAFECSDDDDDDDDDDEEDDDEEEEEGEENIVDGGIVGNDGDDDVENESGSESDDDFASVFGS